MITFKNIKKQYSNKIIFDDFNLKIDKGEKVLLNGKSGKGKTTLFRFILGFDTPDSGEIFINGEKISHQNIAKIRSKIAYVSQDIDLRNIKVSLLIEEIFTYGANKNKDYKSNFENYCKEFSFSLENLDKNVKDLSGGERQRLGLIIALLLDREIMLLDEVTSALDKKLKEKVANLLIKLDKTIIFISHDNIFQDNESVREVKL